MTHLTLLFKAKYLMLTATACQSITGTGAGGCATGLPTVTADNTTIPSVLQIVFGVLAVLAMLMIVIAGLRFVTGQGNPQEMSKARSTVIYALVGLLIALLAEAFVSFVLGKL